MATQHVLSEEKQEAREAALSSERAATKSEMILDVQLRRGEAPRDQHRTIDGKRLHQKQQAIQVRVSNAKTALLDVKLVAQEEMEDRVQRENILATNEINRVISTIAQEMEAKCSKMMLQFQQRFGPMQSQSCT